MIKRKNYIINPKFQYGLIIRFIILALINNLIFYLAAFYFFSNLKSEAIEIGLGRRHVFFNFLSQIQNDYTWFILIGALISSILIFISGVFISHRIAGPLYRLNQHMKSIEDIKNLKTVSFRKGDYFPELETSFNSMSEKIKKNN